MDPARSGAVRQNIINTIKGFDPLEALIVRKTSSLPTVPDRKGVPAPTDMKVVLGLPKELGVLPDEFVLSIENLERLECIKAHGGKKIDGVKIPEHITFTNLGREIIRLTSI